MIDQVIYVSATPADFELGKVRGQVVEQVVRPTGLLDPPVRVRPLQGQVDETIALCRERIARQERVLITTLTRRTAEDLSEYLKEAGLKSRYLRRFPSPPRNIRRRCARKLAPLDLGLNSRTVKPQRQP